MQIQQNGLQIHTCNRQNRKGGGIAIITSSNFKVNKLNTTNFNSFEQAVWEVQLGSTYMTVLGIYHPPASSQHKTSNSDFMDNLTHLLTTKGSEKRNIVLLGDLNQHTDDPEDPEADQLIATIEAFGLKQHNKFPTHQLGHTLDLIATKSSTKLACTAIPRPYLSDHRMVIIETNNKKLTEKPQYKEYRKLTEAVIKEFQQSFNNQPIVDATNLEDAIDQLNDQMLRTLNKVTPLKSRRCVKKAPISWFNKDLLNQMKVVKNREQKWIKYKEPHQWTAFKRERNHYNQMMKFQKRHNTFTRIKDNHDNTRQLYKNNIKSHRTRQHQPLLEAHSDQELAEHFAELFLPKIEIIC